MFAVLTVTLRHGFGDCRKPLQETAALVEDIVYRQMVDVVSSFSLYFDEIQMLINRCGSHP